jgi:hypothetical protein
MQLNGIVEAARGISGGEAIIFTGNGYLHAQRNPVAGMRT